MTQEEKQLLVKDLCARLPYNVRCLHKEDNGEDYIDTIIGFDGCRFEIEEQFYDVEDVKPYLRTMSSMTEEEKIEFQACHCVYDLHPDFQPMMCNLPNELNMFDWLNTHHFDYRGLIPMGLALEAPDDMYKTEEI